MSEVIKTLTKKGDASVEVYPNIKRDNIPSGAVDTSKLDDASVTTAKLVDGVVTANKLGNNAVVTDRIQDGAVTTGKLADGAVTTDKIENGAVIAEKIGSGAVSGVKISTKGVYKSHLSETPITNFGVRKYLQYNVLNLVDLISYSITEFKLCYLVKRYDSDTTFTLIDDLKSNIKPYIIIKYGYINKKQIIDMELSNDYENIIFTLFDNTNGVTTQTLPVNDFIAGITPNIEALSINI